MDRRTLMVVVAVLWLAAAAAVAAGVSPIPSPLTSAVAAAVAAVALTWCAVRLRGRARLVFGLIGGAQWAFAAGDGLWALDDLGVLATGAGSVADLAYLSGYPMLAGGLLALVLVRGGREAVPFASDGLIVGFVAALAVWRFLIAESADGPMGDWLVAAAYPAADVVLLACLVWLATAPGARNAAGILLTVNVGCMVFADLWYAADVAAGGSGASRWIDVAYTVSYLPLVLAALHPDAEKLVRRVPRGAAVSSGRSRVLLLGGGIVAAPVIALAAGGHDHGVAFLVVSVALSTVIVARIAGVVDRASRDRSALEASERLLAHRATHDDLTGLPNRRALLDELAVRLTRPGDGGVIVVVADLDDFNLINDGLGHAVGDELLRNVADRVRDVSGPREYVARVGGDEFVLVAGGGGANDALEAARRLAGSLDGPFALSGGEVYVGASIGVALSQPGEETSAEGLLQDAGIALYRAREHGQGQCRVFGGAMRQWVSERHSLENDLRRAIDRDEISLAYQPQVDLNTRMMVGVEALARWQHPTRGHVSPAQFIPLAESTGLIVRLGERLMAQACADARRWHEVHGPALTVSVNVSARQLSQPDVVQRIRGIIEASEVPPGVMVLELTETALATDPARVRQRMAALRDLGLRIELDDFGTGQSSLAALNTFPLDAVKIDRAFMAGVGEDTRATSALAAVIALIHALGLGSVAEGVETEEQARSIGALGCGRGQGYLFGRPTPAAVIDALLAAGGRLPAQRVSATRSQ